MDPATTDHSPKPTLSRGLSTVKPVQPHHAPEMLCANAKLGGRAIGLIANRRGFLKTSEGPRIGGIVYPESARKVAYFVENAERLGMPLLYLQDVFDGWLGAG